MHDIRNAGEYYIVHGPDRHCRVVERRPVDTTIVQIGPLAFKTRDEADSELRVRCRDGYFREGAVIEERHERIR